MALDRFGARVLCMAGALISVCGSLLVATADDDSTLTAHYVPGFILLSTGFVASALMMIVDLIWFRYRYDILKYNQFFLFFYL